MKALILIILFFQIGIVFSQSRFAIAGKTNVVTNGKAILTLNIDGFYPLTVEKDTVFIRNHSFVFEGKLKYPEEFRITILDQQGQHTITEPFFANAGNHKIIIDSSSFAHDLLDVGLGVSIDNSGINDEYINNYLPLYAGVNKRLDIYLTERNKCDSINNSQVKKECVLKTEAERLNIRKSRDSILLNYAKMYPKSPIIPWMLYWAIRDRGYSECNQSTLDQISKYIEPNINKLIKDFLDKQKIKAPGSMFPLIDFVKANTPGNAEKSKYTLVEFWFSGCGPCIAQFRLLKNTYQKFNNKGFNIIAISSDRKQAVTEYENLIKKNNYPWQQILDLDGVKTKSIDIYEFPSSFLLDSDGRIIKTNVKPIVLDSFLEDNLQ